MPKRRSAKRNTQSAIADGLRFRGRDWYGNLTSTTADVVASLGILNPLRNATLFERLSKPAADFSLFRFRKLVFHFTGLSASTTRGSLAFTAFVNEGFGGGPSIVNEASVKNSGNALILRGDRKGSYPVRCTSQWLALDTNIGASLIGASHGTLYHFIDGTPAAGDLTWDVWIEYDVEFRGPIRPGTTD